MLFRSPLVRQVLAKGSAKQRAEANLLLNEFTEEIQKEQRARGITFVSRTRLETKAYDDQVLTVFRVVLANPLTTRQILSDILAEQKGYGEKLLGEGGRRAKIEALLG